MAKDVVSRLAEEFPKQFSDGKTPYISELPEGWYQLVRGVMKRVDGARIHVKWAQLKEKFGMLRMYENLAPEQYDGTIHEWISEAERLSGHTCQDCGEKGQRTTIFSWACTLCHKCKELRRKH